MADDDLDDVILKNAKAVLATKKAVEAGYDLVDKVRRRFIDDIAVFGVSEEHLKQAISFLPDNLQNELVQDPLAFLQERVCSDKEASCETDGDRLFKSYLRESLPSIVSSDNPVAVHVQDQSSDDKRAGRVLVRRIKRWM